MPQPPTGHWQPMNDPYLRSLLPRDGEHVRVTLEGRASVPALTEDPQPRLRILVGDHFIELDPTKPYVKAVETLTPPEPDWWPPQPGDVIRLGQQAHCHLWVRTSRTSHTWLNPMNHGTHSDNTMLMLLDSGDHTLLVRDGKPYPPANDPHTPNGTPTHSTMALDGRNT